MKHSQKHLLFSLTIKTIILAFFGGLSTIYLSRSTFANPTPRTDQGTRDSFPGGTRGNCFYQNQKPLTPLIPKTNNKLELTLASHPTIFIYLPENKATAAEFILEDSNQEKVFSKTVLLPDSQGIVHIEISSDQPELKVGKNYNWKFILICEQAVDAGMVKGSIKRVNPSPDFTTKLQETPEKDRWLIYSEAGIWYETLMNLAEQIRSHPNDRKLSSEWENLLNSVGLNNVATEPLEEFPLTELPPI
ncbi:MAG: DUF928 domain-containing protein [Trichodesmium sp.]